MPLASYASKAIGLIEELGDDWTEDDYRALRAAFRRMTIADWEAWRSAQRSAVAAFAAATPARRLVLGARHPEPLLLKVAAIQFLAEAAAVLQQADRLHHSIGASYRNMAGLAGEAFQILVEGDPAYKPDHFLPPDWTHVWRIALTELFAESPT